MSKDYNCQKVLNKHYNFSFWITLIISIMLIVGGALTPPLFIIDGSIFIAVGMIFLWPSLAFGAKAIEDGRTTKINFGKNSIHIGVDNNNNGLDDNYEKTLINE